MEAKMLSEEDKKKAVAAGMHVAKEMLTATPKTPQEKETRNRFEELRAEARREMK